MELAECHNVGDSQTAYSHCRLETANEQVVFPAYSAPDGDCDIMICVSKLATNLVKGNKFGVKVKGLTGDSREKPAEASATFISVDNTRAFVTSG